MKPTRRDFVQTAAALLASAALPAAAQQPAASLSHHDIFADFESGSYEGWTLEGDCWEAEPASEQTFAGRIQGFEGDRFLCTLHPRRGTNATGRAISRAFRIERPFIDFLIGGGDHPGETCLNLLVDGRVVRTATGEGTPRLAPALWDVTDWIGKTAHFEVVDRSRAKDRGYVMVDAIRFANTPRFQERVPGQNAFFCFSKEDTAGRDFQARFGTPEGRSQRALTDFCVDTITERLAQLRGGVDRSDLDRCARLLRAEVDRALVRYQVRDALSQQMIAASACSVFTALLTTYDDALGDLIEKNGGQPVTGVDFLNYRDPAVVLRRGKAVCSGIAALEQRLALECRDIGLECFVANGHTRHPDNTPYKINDHGWTLYYLADRNLWAPSDTTRALTVLQSAQTLSKAKFARASLLLVDPLLRDMYSLFHYTTECRVGYPGTNVQERVVNVLGLREWTRFHIAHPYVLQSANTLLKQLNKEDTIRMNS